MKSIFKEFAGGRLVSTEKFLKQRVDGHYTLPNWYNPEGKLRTFACRTNRVSPYRMIVDVPVVGKVGDYLTSYFRDFGKLDGHISDARPGSFLLELDVTYATRQRIANKLVWLEEKQKDPDGVIELRKASRIIPAKAHTMLTLADGAIHECFVIDMSVVGVSVSAEVELPVGTPLAIGACVGRVVRIFKSGFAVKFVEKQREYELERLVIRPLRSQNRGLKASDWGDLEQELDESSLQQSSCNVA
jgi:hypothetical protein